MAKGEQTASYDQTSSETDNALSQNQNISYLLHKPTTLLKEEGPGSSDVTSHNSFEDDNRNDIAPRFKEEQLPYEIEHITNTMDIDNTISQQQTEYNYNNLHLMQHVFQNPNDVLSFENVGSYYTHVDMQNGLQSYPQPSSLLNFLQLPAWPTSAVATSLLPSSSMFPAVSGQWSLNSVPNPPVPYYLLNQAFPNDSAARTVFEVQDNKEENGGQVDNGVSEFTQDVACMSKRKGKRPGKHFATERDRRIYTNVKYQQLSNLIPNQTKSDKASIVEDAIVYIEELKKGVERLKTQVEKKRCEMEKRVKAEDGDVDSSRMKSHCEAERSSNTSWFQTKSKHDTEVDVRVNHDEVTVKLVCTGDCLLVVSKILEEHLLDIHVVSGGMVGEHYSFLFNAKIEEGSRVYANAIANRLIEAVDSQHGNCSQSAITY